MQGADVLNFLATSPAGVSSSLTLVDIGAAGGVQKKWRRHRRRIRPILFEPNPTEAARLRPSLPAFVDAKVVERGLAAAPGSYTLHVAHWPGCTSLLQSDPAVLAGYKIAPLYVTEKQVNVDCVRFDALHRAGEVPAPDVHQGRRRRL